MYFKVTNETETHHGFQYCDGLNIDYEENELRFNKEKNYFYTRSGVRCDSKEDSFCTPSGFHFTNKEILASFFHMEKMFVLLIYQNPETLN